MSKWKSPVALVGGALAVGAVFATTAAAQATPAAAAASTAASTAAASAHQPKPTIVLVAGAFEDSTSWSGEITRLEHDGYPVIAPAVPLRGVASDSAYLTSLVRGIGGPVVLVGHSYGGLLITEIAASDPKQVKALVYTAAFIPEAGETANQLITQFPGSLLGPSSTYTVAIPGGGTDTYVKPADFRALFAADSSAADAAVDAATQRPAASSTLGEPVAAGVPAGIPVYAIVASQDKAIPPAAELFEAKRAGATISTVDSAHDLPSSHPGAVTAEIERAAR
jgi:pimeloyl-ACP methyl ester carboxylesterase